jgi:hypothetical protein
VLFKYATREIARRVIRQFRIHSLHQLGFDFVGDSPSAHDFYEVEGLHQIPMDMTQFRSVTNREIKWATPLSWNLMGRDIRCL